MLCDFVESDAVCQDIFAVVQPKSSDAGSNNPAGMIANWNQAEPAQTQICRK